MPFDLNKLYDRIADQRKHSIGGSRITLSLEEAEQLLEDLQKTRQELLSMRANHEREHRQRT